MPITIITTNVLAIGIEQWPSRVVRFAVGRHTVHMEGKHHSALARMASSTIRLVIGLQEGRILPSTTEAAIGYSPQFSMEEGFRRTINMVRAKRGLPAV
jgi:hypothetical protein